MWAVESADGKWGAWRGEDESEDAGFAVGPRDVTCWSSVGLEAWEKEADAAQT